MSYIFRNMCLVVTLFLFLFDSVFFFFYIAIWNPFFKIYLYHRSGKQDAVHCRKMDGYCSNWNSMDSVKPLRIEQSGLHMVLTWSVSVITTWLRTIFKLPRWIIFFSILFDVPNLVPKFLFFIVFIVVFKGGKEYVGVNISPIFCLILDLEKWP